MKNTITREFTSAGFNNRDCGVKENILLQLDVRNKGVGIISEKGYIFGAFDTSEIHYGIYDLLEEKLGSKHYIIAVMKQGNHIDVNVFTSGDFTTSSFEWNILAQITNECKEARKELPDGITINTEIDDFIKRRREKEDTKQHTVEKLEKPRKTKSTIICIMLLALPIIAALLFYNWVTAQLSTPIVDYAEGTELSVYTNNDAAVTGATVYALINEYDNTTFKYFDATSSDNKEYILSEKNCFDYLKANKNYIVREIEEDIVGVIPAYE